jgi:hypothetical protein
MKNILIISILFFSFQNVTFAQSGWKIGLGINNGISFVNRQPSNNTLNNRKTIPISGRYYNQFNLYGLKPFKSEKGFSTFNISHRTYRYKSSVYDTRLKITSGNAPILSDAIYNYHSYNFSYIYHRHIKTVKNVKLYAGAGIELSYYYKNTIKLKFKDGDQKITKTGSDINENYLINNMPTLVLNVGGEFTVMNTPLRANIVYKKDYSLFISSSIPVFSSIGLRLDIPLKKFKSKNSTNN